MPFMYDLVLRHIKILIVKQWKKPRVYIVTNQYVVRVDKRHELAAHTVKSIIAGIGKASVVFVKYTYSTIFTGVMFKYGERVVGTSIIDNYYFHIFNILSNN